MKKLLVLATIAGLLVGLSWVAAFAVERQGPTVKPQQQQIWLKSNTLQKIISAENDKSQPADSLTQRYRVLIETTSGQKHTVTIQIQMNEKGDILKANNVSATKQAGGSNFEVDLVKGICNKPCTVICTHVVTVPNRPGGRSQDYYICWCCCSIHCGSV